MNWNSYTVNLSLPSTEASLSLQNLNILLMQSPFMEVKRFLVSNKS